MKYYLKHKNINVLEMEIDDFSKISKIYEVYNENHLPINIKFHKGLINKGFLNTWWCDRCIPITRMELDHALKTLGIEYPQELLTQCLGLSVVDAYWVCPVVQDVTWEDINYFDNSFSKVMGEILFGKEIYFLKTISLSSPDITTDGWLKKKWIEMHKKIYLLKAGSGKYHQEPFNEVIATLIMKRLGIEHIKYELMWQDGLPYSLCENFINTNTELINAHAVYSQFKKSNNVSNYEYIINSYENLGIMDARTSIDKMIVVDYLLANTDRHYGNFGIIRNSNTLEVLGVSPIFDSGTSLWMRVDNKYMYGDYDESKSFAKTHTKQIKLIKSFDWLDINLLHDIIPEIEAILKQNSYLDADYKGLILKKFNTRLENLNVIIAQA